MKRCPACKKVVWPWQKRSGLARPTRIHLQSHADEIKQSGIPLPVFLAELAASRRDFPRLVRDYDDMAIALSSSPSARA